MDKVIPSRLRRHSLECVSTELGAKGTEAAKLFLTQMIAHHEGAAIRGFLRHPRTSRYGGKESPQGVPPLNGTCLKWNQLVHQGPLEGL
ncbi:MAG: hypothetical protein ABI568_09050 [Pseudarthrobacter sp.]